MADISTLASLLRDGHIMREDFVSLASGLQRGAEQYSYQPPLCILPAPRLQLPPVPALPPPTQPSDGEHKGDAKERPVTAAAKPRQLAPVFPRLHVLSRCARSCYMR
jgi:hypothetical protein